MPKLKPGALISAPEEEATIQAGIDADPDTFELDDAWFAKARPAGEAHPGIVERDRHRRGSRKALARKHVSRHRVAPSG